ncbi:MAG: hypothetical protein PWP23_524 [Candidatus Sumerlaeota bacterium]|nr:hypothetical protein [Candidatus Sumerlaeota bacterium]
MHQQRFFRPGAAALILAAAATAAFAAPPDMTNRDVLLETSAAKTTATFAVPDSLKPSHTSYALYARTNADDPPLILLNGIPLASAPVPREPGEWLLPLPTADFHRGAENTIALLTRKGAPLAAEQLIVFELLDGAEEAHFGRLFSMPTAEKATPTLHSSQTKYDVLHYDLALDIETASRQINASVVTVTLKSLVEGLDQIAFDFQSDGVLLINSVAAVPAVSGITYSVDDTNDWLIVDLPAAAELDSGEEITLAITYSGTPSSSAGAFGLNSYNRTTQPNGKAIVYSFSEPYSARSWWPCKDVPSDKATIDLHITVPSANMVVTNGTQTGTTTPRTGRTTYHFTHGYPVATYLVAFCATEYAYASDNYLSRDGLTQMEVGHYVYETSTDELAAVSDTIDVMGFYADHFGEYPFLDEKYVTMTWGGSFGMEHQTCTSINNRNLASGGKSRRNVHELAHQWFGDYVTPDDFIHLWLNEGFATFCEALFVEHDEGFASYKSYIQGWISSGISDTTPLVYSNADSFSTSVVYRKGGMVLHMLRGVMGDDAFFEGIRAYLAAHAYGNAESADLQAAMEAAHGASLNDFFQDWVYGTGKPSYQWSWSLDENTLNVSITQTQSADVFELPVRLVATLEGGGTHEFVVQNTQRTQTFDLDATGLSITNMAFDPDYWIYKGSVTSGAIEAPKATLLSVRASAQPGEAVVTWESGGGTTEGFEISASSTMTGTTIVASSSTLGVDARSHTLTGLAPNDIVYVKVRAVSSQGLPSAWSDVYAVQTGIASDDRVLIVDGYDRWEASISPENSHSFAAIHADALYAAGIAFDSCANETLGSTVSLPPYDAVILVLGEESTIDRTFTSSEETLVKAYLDAGGQFFVTGAEIGWDIGRSTGGNPSLAFYNGYLKASYEDDDSKDYTVAGTSGGIFDGLAFDYGTGASPYYPDWPDVITAAEGGTICLEYNAAAGAGVQYEGTFGSGTATGRVVTFGFPFETIGDESARHEVMARIVTFFELSPALPVTLDGWMVY